MVVAWFGLVWFAGIGPPPTLATESYSKQRHSLCQQESVTRGRRGRLALSSALGDVLNVSGEAAVTKGMTSVDVFWISIIVSVCIAVDGTWCAKTNLGSTIDFFCRLVSSFS